MPARDREALRRTAAVLWRISFPVVTVLSLVLGFVGLRQYLAEQEGYSHALWDLLYYDLQLFVLGAPPLDEGGELPVALQIARFAAPAVTVYAVVEAARLLFAAEIVRLRGRWARDHAVVCGDSLVARAVTERLLDAGSRVVRIVRPEERTGRQGRLLTLPGDETHADALRGAGLHRAATLYACSADPARNLAVVLAAADIRRRRTSLLQVRVQVDDPELCLALQARRLGLQAVDRLRIDFFNWHEIAARHLLGQRPPSFPEDRTSRVMFVGASWFGGAVVVELARHWRLHRGGSRRRLEVIVVDEHASAAVARLGRLYPFVTEVCRFTAHDVDVPSLLDGDLPGGPPDQVYLCCDDEGLALKLALTMDHFWRGGPQSVVVRLSQLGGLAGVFHGPDRQLLDAVSGTLHPFDALQAGTDLGLLADSLTERLARGIHERYLGLRLAEGAVLGATPAMRGWDGLPEEIKEANRAQAADIAPKLESIGCALAPNPVWGAPEVLDDEATEHLARREHDRWCAHMRAAGWRAGPRDDGARRHPDLVDWEQLSAPAREKDREAVRALPALLADAGFRIVRVRPTAAAPRPRLPGSHLEPTTGASASLSSTID